MEELHASAGASGAVAAVAAVVVGDGGGDARLIAAGAIGFGADGPAAAAAAATAAVLVAAGLCTVAGTAVLTPVLGTADELVSSPGRAGVTMPAAVRPAAAPAEIRAGVGATDDAALDGTAAADGARAPPMLGRGAAAVAVRAGAGVAAGTVT